MSMTTAGLGIAAALFAALVLSGCAKEQRSVPPEANNPFAGTPFVLLPDAAGRLVMRDANGKPLDGPVVSLPVEAKAVQAVTQITVLKIEGSCYYLVCYNGSCTKVPC
jgi:PBP1b-binding outer membrane lipoprotein LpoB